MKLKTPSKFERLKINNVTFGQCREEVAGKMSIRCRHQVLFVVVN